MIARLVDEIRAESALPAHSSPNAFEFESAYQSRVACDRIRFVIKNVEDFGAGTGTLGEACFQLMDALRRLENIDRRFLRCSVRNRRRDTPSVEPNLAGLLIHDERNRATRK
jgi:hypothetical protein